MTLYYSEILLYMGALAILFFTPGPVWVALVARGVSGGFHAAWPLALGVVVGDIIWPLLAIFGVSLLVEVYADFLDLLRYGGAVILVWMGVRTIRNADKPLVADERLSASGMWAGFVAGLMVIIGNPKAILFYMGVLPNFFDINNVSTPDIVVICFISGLVPLTGNIMFALSIDRIRRFLSSAESVRRTNLISGSALVLVGAVIAVL
jgi:threonine/homoserine/homoserine lactone efflux protein